MKVIIRALSAAATIWCCGILGSTSALAITCEDPRGFDKWLGDVRQEAARQGISPAAIRTGLAGVKFDQGVLRRDRNQRFFRQSFEDFSKKMVPPYRIQKGTALLKQHARLLQRIEQRFGVPGPVLVAIWGLESDFGAVRGKLPVIQSVATLAYDCRRTELFLGQLFDALRIVESGDLTPDRMRGAWAGELGQTQFLASSYVKYAIDFDGDGRRDLVGSIPDVLASTANYLQAHGWRRGEPWDVGTPNFEALRAWNKSQVYARTIGFFADRLSEGRRAAR